MTVRGDQIGHGKASGGDPLRSTDTRSTGFGGESADSKGEVITALSKSKGHRALMGHDSRRKGQGRWNVSHAGTRQQNFKTRYSEMIFADLAPTAAPEAYQILCQPDAH